MVRALLIALLAGTLAGNVAAAERIKGTAEVVSGESLSVAGKVLRLVGIDAPEKGQLCRVASGRAYDCGLVSRTALMDLTAATPVSCRLTGRTHGAVPEAQCFAGGYDLSRGMVHTGWALAWPRTGTVYARIEGEARAARRGLWHGAFVTPWDWRRGKRLAARPKAP